MKPAICLFAAALSLAGQPKLLVNAKPDTRSAAAGLEREFKALLAAQPQPAWIGYTVPSLKTVGLGCDYVRDGNAGAGVVHLEPPDHVIVLIRVENNAVDRVRALSPYCEIDAGDLPMHWLTDVAPAQSVALLASLVSDRERSGEALRAVAAHADPSAGPVLDRYLAPDQPQSLRLRAVSYLVYRDLDAVKKVIAADPDIRVRERAISSLGGSRRPETLDLLLSIARTDSDARLRQQAVSALSGKSGPTVVAALTDVAEKDADRNVQRRALSALANMPDGEGVPVLIRMAKSDRDTETRKQAMTSLQHSRDPRALAFFEDVLRK